MAGRACLPRTSVFGQVGASPDWRGVRPVDRPGCAVEQSAASADAQQLTQNWHGPGESDCLIKTEHCDVRNRGIDAM